LQPVNFVVLLAYNMKKDLQAKRKVVKDILSLSTRGLKVYRYVEKNPECDLTPFKDGDIASVLNENGSIDEELAQKKYKETRDIGILFFAGLINLEFKGKQRENPSLQGNIEIGMTDHGYGFLNLR